MKLIKKIIIPFELELITGLHIGDSKDNVEIGSVDSPVVRRKDNNEPYIPGSSLKGKLRSLLEIATGSNATTSFSISDYDSEAGKPLFHLFGGAGDEGKPSRILVRDAYLNDEWRKFLKFSENTDMPFTELKFENTINRLEGTAGHPRQIERVPAGSVFVGEIIINLMDEGNESTEVIENKKKTYINLVKSGIELLHDDYLGGSGSRGYGQVHVKLKDPIEKSSESYFNNG